MAGKGATPKPALTEGERFAVLALLSKDNYRGSGYRAGAALVSAMRKAHEASTEKARAKRTVSPTWLKNALLKCDVDGSAKLILIKRKARQPQRTVTFTAYEGPRIDRADSTGQVARVREQEKAVPAKDQEETKGATA